MSSLDDSRTEVHRNNCCIIPGLARTLDFDVGWIECRIESSTVEQFVLCTSVVLGMVHGPHGLDSVIMTSLFTSCRQNR
jgi:hypothetical protein